MRNTQRSRNIALGFFASGWVAAVAAFLLPASSADSWIRPCLFIYGLSAIFFGGGTAVFRHFDARAKDALARGEDVVARWRVESAAWKEFVANDRKSNDGVDFLPNELSVPREVPDDGIEVIVGKTALQVGESIHRLPRRGTPEITDATLSDGRPAVIELRLYYPGRGHGASGVPRSPMRTALRFPVGRGAWKEAGVAVSHFRGDAGGAADFFHGKGDGTNPEDLSKCYHCGYETHRYVSHCPQCGRAMQSKRWARRFGVGLLLCGLFITGIMTIVLFAIAPMLLRPALSSGGSRFSGTAAQARLVLGILGAVELFGVTALCYGLWQIVTGRRSKCVIYFAVGLFLALLLAALVL
ncbi:hypothetical protein BH20VER3_BH20VER3_07050 [soil metagenome]